MGSKGLRLRFPELKDINEVFYITERQNGIT